MSRHPAPNREQAASARPRRSGGAGRRVLIAAAIGIIAGGAVTFIAPWQVADLAGWDTAAVLFLSRVWFTVGRLDASSTKAVARREDPSVATADLVIVFAGTACIAGAGLTLIKAAHSSGAAKALLIALAVFSVVVSWASVHSVYTLRYARLYYGGEGGGINFNEERDAEPTYIDFAYVAFTVGMTFQVSDTNITRRPIRRAILAHALLSYLFGVVIVGLTINIVASLLH